MVRRMVVPCTMLRDDTHKSVATRDIVIHRMIMVIESFIKKFWTFCVPPLGCFQKSRRVRLGRRDP